jgi:hypothetical protein
MKKTTLLAGLIACIFFMSCKKDSSSSSPSSTGTTIKYEITSADTSIFGIYATAAGYDLSFYAPNTNDWTMTFSITKPYSAHLEYLGSKASTLTISVNNNVVKTQVFPSNTSMPSIYYTVN